MIAPKQARSKGFSLLEMLISLAVVLIMYALMLGPMSKAYQKKQMVKCSRNLQLIHLAMGIYANDYSGTFPDSVKTLIPRYTTDTNIFVCPGQKDAGYAYYRGRTVKDGPGVALMSDAQVNEKPKLEKELMFSDDGKPPGNNHKKYGGNILFCDGHVEGSTPNATHALTFQEPVVLINPKQ